MPELLHPEKKKKEGVRYALSEDGFEIPILDMTHPVFAFNPAPQELQALEEKYLATERRREKVPAFFQRLSMRFLLGKSTLGKGLARARGGFLKGMDTYLMKLGADNLGDAYSVPIDRKIAASFPALSLRLRIQDLARLMGGQLVPLLAEAPGKDLIFVNIGGGTAIDSLNSLILIYKKHGPKLQNRSIKILVLDLEADAPRFGARACEALCAPGGVLEGLQVEFQHFPYDWSRAQDLESLLAPFKAKEALLAISTEGALFEYGSDEEILENLRVLDRLTSPQAFVVGSVTRADGPGVHLNRNAFAKIRPRTLISFEALVQSAAWKVESGMERPFAHNLLLIKMPKP